MHIFPHNKQEWLGALLFPFKAYTVIAPVLFLISDRLPHYPHSGATYAEGIMILGLFPDAAFLLFASILLSFFSPKGSALPCLVFGLAALIIGIHFFTRLASA